MAVTCFALNSGWKRNRLLLSTGQCEWRARPEESGIITQRAGSATSNADDRRRSTAHICFRDQIAMRRQRFQARKIFRIADKSSLRLFQVENLGDQSPPDCELKFFAGEMKRYGKLLSLSWRRMESVDEFD
jgi:hypothetical protein